MWRTLGAATAMGGSRPISVVTEPQQGPQSLRQSLGEAHARVVVGRNDNAEEPGAGAVEPLPDEVIPTYGRAEVVARLDASRSAVTLLVGDSGVGKSRVLWGAQAISAKVAVSPAPVQVRQSPGSLQLALLEALGSAVSELARDEPTLKRVGRVLADASARVRDARLHDLSGAVGRHVLGLVRSRLGETVGDLLADYAGAVSTSIDERLAAWITSASDPDVLEVFVHLASEVGSLAASPIILAIDDVQRLDSSDRRRLADLVQRLPEGVRIRGSFAASSASTRDQAEALEAAGVNCLQLDGLDLPAVREWLSAKGIEPSRASDVMRATHGYALYVEAAIRLLLAGDSLSTLGADQILIAATRRSWRELNVLVKGAAVRLLPLTDPLTEAEAAEYLGMDIQGWGVIDGCLQDAGIFTSGGGTSWFHELRRRCIWDHVLTATQRQQTVSQSRPYVLERLNRNGIRPDLAIQYKALLLQDAELMAADLFVKEAAEATRDELAIASALIELVEEGHPALDTNDVLLYARENSQGTGDLLAALERLKHRRFVVIASNQYNSVVVPAVANARSLLCFRR